jgi:hypothetical protein
MRDQLQHLAIVSDLSTVSVQVLPNDAGAHPSMDGAFNILTFPEDTDPSVLYVAYLNGSLQPEEVAAARLVFDRLRGAGLQEPGWWAPRVRWLRVAGVARCHGARWSGVSGATVLASAM